jgi:hypothetical protein
MDLFTALLACLLPEDWRHRNRRENVRFVVGTTALTAAAQVFGALWLGARCFLRYRARYADFGAPDLASGFLVGATVFIGFFFTFWGLFCLWLFSEGLVRAFSALVLSEPLASLPLWAADRAWRAIRKQQVERALPPELPDQVELDGDRLVIRASRRRDWDALTTLEYRERLYVVSESTVLAGPRPHVYRLAPAPDGHIVRRLVRYSR